LLPQEVADIVKRFLGCAEESDVGGKNGDHALPRMDLDGTARAFEALAIAKRVVEEYFIFTYVNFNGWRPGQIAIKRGDACGSLGSCPSR
jgi:hypothetical protein